MEQTVMEKKRGKRKEWSCWCWGLITLFLVFGLYAPNVYGMTELENGQSFYASGLQIQVEAGYESIVRLGRDTSFYITIQPLEADFYGTVILNIPDALGETVSYSKQVSVLENGKRCIIFSIPVINEWSSYSIEIKDENETSIFYHEFKIDVKTDMQSTYVGALSDSPENLSYINAENVVYVEIDDKKLHYTKTDWDLFDVLLIDDFDMNQLDAELFQNLLHWVKEGGSLVLGTGQQYEKTLQRFLEEEVIVANIRGLSLRSTLLGKSAIEIEQMKKERERTIESAVSLNDERVKTYVLNFRIENSLILREESIALVEELAYGEGHFLIYHVALGDQNFQNHILSLDISKLILDHMSEQRKDALYYSLYEGNVDTYSMNVVKESSDVMPPPLTKYIVITVIYLIMIGPLLYFVLMKLNRQKLLWRLMPLITLMFMMITLAAGRSTRIRELKSTYYSLLYYDNHQVEESSVFSLTVPYNDEFQVIFDTDTKLSAINNKRYAHFTNLSQQIAGNARKSYQRRISEEEEEKVIDLKEIAPYSATYFTASKEFTTEGSYVSNLHFSVQGFDGSFTNELGFDLTDTFLISSASIVSLGTIGDGETVSLIQGNGAPLLSCDYYTVSNYVEGCLNQNTQESNLTYEKSNAINSMIQLYFKGNRSQDMVVSFVHSNYSNGIVSALRNQSDSIGIEMIVLPVEVDYQDGEVYFVPELGSDYQILEGGYTLGDRYRCFSGTLTVEYQLPKDENITSFYYTDFLNREFDTITYSGFSGKIYFYNRKTQKYDHVFGNDEEEVVNLSNYLSSQNTIIVKYREKHDFLDYYMSIPYISYFKEVE